MAEPENARSVAVSQLELLQLLRVIVRGFRRGSVAAPAEEPLGRASEAGTPGERHMRRAAAAGTLGQRHFPILLSLALEGPATVSELAGRVVLAPATTSLLVNELSRAGLVQRQEDDTDRRRTIVSLPDQYRLPIERRATERIAPLRRALARLEPEVRDHFIAGLRVLAEELSGESEESAAPQQAVPGGRRPE
ncbi:MAG TPA: MarR family transcriptional regulator [Chloroflexota bacterium]|jgi:DNA-binding MarR family transcriptional regulator|nr:MarR family transcriptional regulator [Chloroflexota bacterium]